LREDGRLRVFENMVMRRIFGSKRNKLTEEWRKLNTEKLYDLYSSPNTVRLKKSRKVRWEGYVARMGREDVYTGIWWGSLSKRNQLEDPFVD
jgi:hypothetical protein